MGKPVAMMLNSPIHGGGDLSDGEGGACLSILSACGLGAVGINALTNRSATTQVNPEDTDALLAKEMNKLSTEERDRVFEEVHGVAGDMEEDPDFVEMKLSEMEEEILKIRKRQAYDRAAFVSPKAVRDRAFRLMFLRSEYFDARKAAKRMVSS